MRAAISLPAISPASERRNGVALLYESRALRVKLGLFAARALLAKGYSLIPMYERSERSGRRGLLPTSSLCQASGLLTRRAAASQALTYSFPVYTALPLRVLTRTRGPASASRCR